jgi:hypothetical protein
MEHRTRSNVFIYPHNYTSGRRESRTTEGCAADAAHGGSPFCLLTLWQPCLLSVNGRASISVGQKFSLHARSSGNAERGTLP